MIDIAHEFGYKIRSFHHARRGLQDRRPAREGGHLGLGLGRLGRLQDGGARRACTRTPRSSRAPARASIVHSDSAIGSQRLNQEAAKAMAAGREIGIQLGGRAIKWITAIRRGRSASTIGSARSRRARTPTSCSGRRDPFSVYAHAEKVWIDGALRLDRPIRRTAWRTDFELGFVPAGSTREPLTSSSRRRSAGRVDAARVCRSRRRRDDCHRRRQGLSGLRRRRSRTAPC